MEKQEFLSKVVSALFRFHFNTDVACFIACQFALESDFGKSKIAKSFSNYCGMKLPRVRISTAENLCSTNDVFAHYSCLFDCVLDFVLCLLYHHPLRSNLDTIKHYKSFIKWYCPDSDYVEKIQIIYNQYFNH